MAPFALKFLAGKEGISRMFSGIHPRTPWVHFPWFWWQCLTLSGLDELWPADELNAGTLNMRGFFRRLVCRSGEERQKLLLRRLYRPHLSQPRNYRHPRRSLWSKGGMWKKDGMGKILVLKEHIERDLDTVWGRKLGLGNIRLIEKELMRIVDPDRLLVPEAYFLACNYVRSRTKELKGRRMDWKYLIWFFETDIQVEGQQIWWRKADWKKMNGYLHPAPMVW
jgi:hypothetical protein